jgi:hypothetical protein
VNKLNAGSVAEVTSLPALPEETILTSSWALLNAFIDVWLPAINHTGILFFRISSS